MPVRSSREALTIRITRTSLLALVLLSGCKREEKTTPAPAPPLPPLQAPATTLALPTSGFGDGVVTVPVGATRPLPVVVAVLGIGDTPEEQCAAWRDLVGAHAFVLCPRGAKHMVPEDPEPAEDAGEGTSASSGAGGTTAATDDSPEEEKPSGKPDSGRFRQVGYYPVDTATLQRELQAGLAALKAKFGAHVADGEVLYTGFSRGAFLGASVGAKEPARFPRLVLIEGGQSPWKAETAAAFARSGGKRVLFACGQPKCVEDADSVAPLLRAQKVEVRVVHGAGEGHGYKKQVKEELRRSLAWVVEGDPRWRELYAR